ncbi:MAG: hypothetical protein LBS01_07805 [Prevotellaceae bacterium]|jgi:C-terminal processing protease CtpA/Prc|nr:hypothetical protein [Prevotellaceae bacterium]
MKKLFIVPIIIFALASCSKNDEPKNNYSVVNQFIYDGMSLYYLWADDMPANQNVTSEPVAYFTSLLNATDQQQGWSFITDDVQSLLAQFAGEPLDFGYDLIFAKTPTAGEYVAIVKYVYPNTPAAAAGIKRLDLISKINGQPITANNYYALFGSETISLSMCDFDLQIIDSKTITPAKIETNPVLYSNIYEVNGKKIAYLFYTSFIENYNNKLYETFQNFKQQGVTDLVLDLRYNHGGHVSAAVYLASLVAPRSAVESRSAYVTMTYNSFLTNEFKRGGIDTNDYLGIYNFQFPNPLDANLDLNKIYIIATDDSYSAAELTAFGLKAYMNVTHIGGKTGGKYTASTTLHAYDNNIGIPIYTESSLSTADKKTLENWAIQPIVAIYGDKNGKNFSNPGYLQPDVECEEGFGYLSNWKPIGDTDDTFLGEAIYAITGNESYKPQNINMIRETENTTPRLHPAELKNPKQINNSLIINRFPAAKLVNSE